MDSTYLERYLSGGEEVLVWHELVALGSAIRTELLVNEVEGVVREALQRVQINLDLLIPRLRSLGYQFVCEYTPPQTMWALEDLGLTAYTHPPVEPLQPVDWEELALVETQHGPLPLVLRRWYELIGFVDLSGYHPVLSWHAKISNSNTLSSSRHTSKRRGPYSTPLAVIGWDDESVSEHYYHRVLHDHRSGECPGDGLWVGLPCNALDARVGSPGHQEQMRFDNAPLFLDYIRTAFQWGGFYGFSQDPEAAEEAREELEFLTNGLLPI
jgi:hypothetical protein